jgi:ATP synthase protein I
MYFVLVSITFLRLCSGWCINSKTMSDEIPGSGGKRSGGRRNGLDALVKAEKLSQIAFVLPVSVVVGWGAGVLLDRWLHQHWIYIVGLILGSIAGLVEAVRLALRAGK